MMRTVRTARERDGSVTLYLAGSPGPSVTATVDAGQVCDMVDTRKIARALKVSCAGYRQILDVAYALGLRRGHPKRAAFLRAALADSWFTSDQAGRDMRTCWIRGNS